MEMKTIERKNASLTFTELHSHMSFLSSNLHLRALFYYTLISTVYGIRTQYSFRDLGQG